MGSVKKRRSESDSRRKNKHKKRNKSGRENEGVKYLGHAGKEVNVVLGNNASPGSIRINIHQDQRVSKSSTVEREDRRKRAKERARKKRKYESAKGQERLQEKAMKKAQKRIEKRRRKYVRQTGNDVSLDEFKSLEKTEKEQMAQRGKQQVDPSSGMAPISAYFLPREPEEEEENTAASSQSNVDTVVRMFKQLLPGDREERTEDTLPPETQSEEHNNSTETRLMYLRLAYLDRRKVNKMRKTPAADLIRKTELIGPVFIEGMIGRSIAKIDQSEFLKLSDFDLYWGGAQWPKPQNSAAFPLISRITAGKRFLVHCSSGAVLFLARVHTRGFCNTQRLLAGCHFRNGNSFIVGDGGGKLGFRCFSSSQKYCSAVWLAFLMISCGCGGCSVVEWWRSL